MMTQSLPYTVDEVTSADSPYLPGMNDWLNQIFPEYAPPHFEALLAPQCRHDNPPTVQIFVGQAGGQVAGLVQMLYRVWQGGLIADIDLLGVLEPYRRSGLGAALVRRAILAAQDMTSLCHRPAIGVVSLADPAYAPVIQLHHKLKGQVRTDFLYPSGDAIVWYPLTEGFAAVKTKALAEQLQQFGDLLSEMLSSQGDCR